MTRCGCDGPAKAPCGCVCVCHAEQDRPWWPGPCAGCCEPGDECQCGTDLRHSAATILYGAGVPLEAIADMLGHSTTRVTSDLYRHRVEQVQRGAADAMEAAVG